MDLTQIVYILKRYQTERLQTKWEFSVNNKISQWETGGYSAYSVVVHICVYV